MSDSEYYEFRQVWVIKKWEYYEVKYRTCCSEYLSVIVHNKRFITKCIDCEKIKNVRYERSSSCNCSVCGKKYDVISGGYRTYRYYDD